VVTTWQQVLPVTKHDGLERSVEDWALWRTVLDNCLASFYLVWCCCFVCNEFYISSYLVWIVQWCWQVQQYKTRCGELELESRRCPADVSLVTCQFFTYLLTQRVDLSSAITLRLHTARVCTQSVTSVTDTDAWTQTDTYMRQFISWSKTLVLKFCGMPTSF